MDRELELDEIEVISDVMYSTTTLGQIKQITARVGRSAVRGWGAARVEWDLIPLRMDAGHVIAANQRALSRLVRAGDPRYGGDAETYQELTAAEDDITLTAGVTLQISAVFVQYARGEFGNNAIDDLFARIGLALLGLEARTHPEENDV